MAKTIRENLISAVEQQCGLIPAYAVMACLEIAAFKWNDDFTLTYGTTVRDLVKEMNDERLEAGQ